MKNKQDINSKLRAFNRWFDEFILVAAKPLAMLGFAMGTVDIFVRGSLATNYLFALAWAVVQALTIDGLFFAVWWRIFAIKWEPGKRSGMAGLITIGVILSLVAMLTNSIIGMQQLWGLADSQEAMIRLGISPFWFSLARAVLVVAVSTMVAFVSYKSEYVTVQGEEESTTTAQSAQPSTTTVQQVAQPAQLPAQPAQPIAQPLLLAQHSENNDRDRVFAALLTRTQAQQPINLKDVALETGVAYDKVRKLAPAIKKSLTQKEELQTT